MLEIKQQLADLADQEGQAGAEEIRVIIINVLEENNLDTVISEVRINQLIQFFENYQETGAVNSEEVKEQLDQLSVDLQDRFGDMWRQAEDSGVFDRIGSFFRDLFNYLVNLFN